MGQLQAAFAAGDTAVQIARRLQQPHDVAANLEVLAQLHREVGDDRRAMALYEEAQAINTSLGATVEQGSDIRQQAEILRELGQGSSALNAATRALRLHREAGAAFEELSDVLLLAEITSEAGDSASARKYVESARELAEHLDVRTARSEVALVEARIAARVGQHARVRQVLEARWGDLTSGDYDTEWQAWDLRAGAELGMGSLREAAASSRRAVEAIERVRSSITSPSQQTGFLSRRARVYARLVEILMRLGLVDEGFGVADDMRGRALADRMTGPDTLAVRVRELEARMRELERDGNPSWQEALVRIDAELAQARRMAPKTADISPAERASAIRPHLGSNEALLMYVVSDDRLHTFVMRRDRLQHFGQDISADAVAARVRLVRDLVGRSDPGVDRVLEGLDRLLIAPARDAGLLRGIARLVIVPHGALTYLPFGALRDSTSGRYQVQEYSLAILPSATAMLGLRQRRASGRNGLPGTVLAPAPERLPASRAEAEAFRRTVAGSKALIGPVATASATRRALESDKLVHIAGHAAMNPINPLYSRIELADGFLEVRELVGLNIQSRLVYLSACETAMGGRWGTSYQAGEDYATLGQALLMAGAESAVATLWRIDDQAAAILAEAFYRHLRSVPPMEALARAQRDLLARSELARPYFWAGHVLVGAP
jgi:CHAT domain-containing protein